MVEIHVVTFAKMVAKQWFLALYVNPWFATLTALTLYLWETALDECALGALIQNLMLIMKPQNCQDVKTVVRCRKSW